MKTTKKVIALLVAAVMVFALSAVAFAATDYKITVNNNKNTVSIDGKTYNAYKLFDVTYADVDDEEGNDAYSYTITTDNQFYTDAAAKAIIDKYFTLSATKVAGVYNVAAKDGFDARAFGDELQTVMEGKTPEKSAAASGETAVIDNLPAAGYYIVTGEGTAPENQKVTAAVALTTTEPEAEINAKLDAPTIEKTVTDDEKTADSYDVGDVVPFTITSKVPVTDGYTTYKFYIHDTMSDGLTFDKESVAVTIGGDELAKNTDYKVAVNTKAVDGCTFEIQIEDLLKKANGERMWADGDEIVVTYNATLNANALVTDFESNKAKLEYSKNPFDSNETGETPEVEDKIYDFELSIDKYDANNEDLKLEGAKFVLVKTVEEDGEDVEYFYKKTNTDTVDWVASLDDATVVVTDDEGLAAFAGLKEGTYALRETEAPAGYNLLTEDVAVEITATYENGALVESSATLNEDGDAYVQTQEVANNTGAILPATGGMGTTIFYIVGAILVAGAFIVLVSKKRMAAVRA